MSWTILAPTMLVGWAGLLILLERWKPYDRGQPFLHDGFWVDLVPYALVQSYVLALVIGAIVGPPRHGLVSDWPIWLQVGFFVLTHDLYIYAFHRLQHHNRFLWRLHEAHHSAIHVDWLAGARSHALEILINQTVEVGAMVVLGADPDVILIKMAISAMWGMWIHANLDVRTGWLQRIINGPEMHRWHHAAKYRPPVGANFATKFAVWDWIFGTAYRPDAKPDGYGLAASFPRGYVAQHVHSLRSFEG